jgi:hypothetical protein
VNCWHANEHESAAMWKLYGHTDESVAVETEYGILADVLPTNVYLGLVNYIDYESQWLPEGNTFYAFVHKRRSFEHEREVRAIIQDFPTQDNKVQTGAENDLPGLHVEVDVGRLVKHVHISPTSPEWFHSLITDVTRQFGLTFDIQKSNLSSEPLF